MAVDMASEEENTHDATTQHTVMNSTFPVLLPEDAALFMPEAEFQDYVKKLVTDARSPILSPYHDETAVVDGSQTAEGKPSSAFMDGLHKHAAHLKTPGELAAENKTLTENRDVTNISAKNPLVNLFYDINGDINGERSEDLLENAWKEDALMTFKIIFNARSIHLGKSDRMASYKAFGWLAEKHPLTLLASLKWLVRPIIQKKMPKAGTKETEKTEGGEKAKVDEDEDYDMLDADEKHIMSNSLDKSHDVRFGVSHGYWKDLLNVLVFAANDELKAQGDHKSLLNQHPNTKYEGKLKREWDPRKAKDIRKEKTRKQHERVLQKLKEDGFYRALHLTVARLFAHQLQEDVALLKSGKKSDLKKLSLTGKWVPSFAEFHDKHTFVLSSIAEILFPNPAELCPDAGNRELYLRFAREAYRMKIGSPLRKALSVVERGIAAKSTTPDRFAGEINYDRIPSLAMDRYTSLFIKKDLENFAEYTNKVAAGAANISGATLLPSTLIQKALKIETVGTDMTEQKDFAAVKASAEGNIIRQVIDGQWKSLVQRVRDSGTLESSIAVCDVSGSMTSSRKRLADSTTPMDSAIGLSLLLAEICAPPFGGSFITFSESPTVLSAGGEQDTRDLVEKAAFMRNSEWGYTTNFTSVFEKLILPMAIKHNLKQEDMVKQVFVFSDMQFNDADTNENRWTSSFERIKALYAAAGYEMPKLIFWNLAGKRTDKPTTMDDVNTALVSGYSQGMLKVFLDGGGFEDTEEEEVEVVENEDGVAEVVVKKKMDALTVVKRAISHDAYKMLNIVD